MGETVNIADKTAHGYGPPWFDTELGAWMITRYVDVVAALDDARLVPPNTPSGDAGRDVRVAVRAGARQAHGTNRLAEWTASLHGSARDFANTLPRSGAVDVVHAFAAPWSATIAKQFVG